MPDHVRHDEVTVRHDEVTVRHDEVTVQHDEMTVQHDIHINHHAPFRIASHPSALRVGQINVKQEH